MKVLVLNCGSSSVKFQLVDTDESKAASGTDRTLAGGIGENAPAIRARALEGLHVVGLCLDAERNASARGEAEISPAGAGCRVFVVPTNEELLIARDTFAIVRGLPLQ